MNPLDYFWDVDFEVGFYLWRLYLFESPQLGVQLIDVILLFEERQSLVVGEGDSLVEEFVEVELVLGEEAHRGGVEVELHGLEAVGQGKDIEVEGVGDNPW